MLFGNQHPSPVFRSKMFLFFPFFRVFLGFVFDSFALKKYNFLEIYVVKKKTIVFLEFEVIEDCVVDRRTKVEL